MSEVNAMNDILEDITNEDTGSTMAKTFRRRGKQQYAVRPCLLPRLLHWPVCTETSLCLVSIYPILSQCNLEISGVPCTAKAVLPCVTESNLLSVHEVTYETFFG